MCLKSNRQVDSFSAGPRVKLLRNCLVAQGLSERLGLPAHISWRRTPSIAWLVMAMTCKRPQLICAWGSAMPTPLA